MQSVPDTLDIRDLPPYIQSWSVAGIPGFVVAVLRRWQRHHGSLPQRFHMVMCPQVELNAMGGIPPRVHELTDPRLRCRHFTGCHKPYFVVIFEGDDAPGRVDEVLELLSWSEAWEVALEEEAVKLVYRGSTEDLDREQESRPGRSLQELLQSGELVSILA